MSVLKYSEWESGAGSRWYCNDTSALPKWWAPARMLEIELDDFIQLLINDYNAKIVCYNRETDILIYYFDKYSDAHKFVLFVNREARKRGFTV